MQLKVILRQFYLKEQGVKSHIIIYIFIAFLILGCSSKTFDKTTEKGLFNVQLTLSGGDLKTGKNKGSLRITEKRGTALAGASIEITPWMPKMGHGVMLIPQVKDNGNGTYDIKDIFISMKGGWELEISIKSGDVKDDVTYEFPDVH